MVGRLELSLIAIFMTCDNAAPVNLHANTFFERQVVPVSREPSDASSLGLPFILVTDNALDFSATDVSGWAGEKIPLDITSKAGASPDDIFMITGLPPELKLNRGRLLDNFWLVQRSDLGSLAVTAPNNFFGKLRISVTRATAGSPPVTLGLNLSIQGPELQDAQPQKSDIPKSRSFYLRSSEDIALLEKANSKLKEGDVAAARAIFEYLADKGDADAALAMGETYDPVILSGMRVKGLRPDQAKAEAWYRKARELGGPQAQSRLNALSQN
jgi:hypothetical protein